MIDRYKDRLYIHREMCKPEADRVLPPVKSFKKFTCVHHVTKGSITKQKALLEDQELGGWNLSNLGFPECLNYYVS